MFESLPLPASPSKQDHPIPLPRWSTRAADALFGYDFFLSYSQKDGTNLPFALKGALEAKRFRIFLDQTDYVPGIDLRAETKRQVRKSKKLVVVARPGALRSEWVLREVNVAVEAQRLPVVLNINGSVESAAADSQLAQMIRNHHWLRIDEVVSGLDTPVSQGVIDELARGFTHTLQEEKRRRIVAAAILVLCGATGFAGWMAIEAERQRAVAVKNFDIATTAADTLVVDIARGLRNVEGMRVDSVEKILSRADKAYASLASQVGDSPQILRGRVSMYNEFVETYLAKGDTGRAAEAAASSVAAARRLIVILGTDRVAERSLGLALLKEGDAFAEIGKFGQAETAYEEARQIQEKLTANDPSDLVAKRDLGVAFVRLGTLASQRLNWIKAQVHLEQALKIREGIVQGRPAWRRDVALTHIELIDVALAQQRIDEARTHALAAQSQFAILQGEDLSSTKALRDLAVAYQRLGNVEMADRQFDSARNAYAASRERFLRLREKDPGNTEWERDVLAADSKFLELAEAHQRRSEARNLAKQLIAGRERLLARSPDNNLYRQDLSEARDILARIGKR